MFVSVGRGRPDGHPRDFSRDQARRANLVVRIKALCGAARGESPLTPPELVLPEMGQFYLGGLSAKWVDTKSAFTS